MEALTAFEREHLEGVRDCFYALYGLGFTEEAEKGIPVLRVLFDERLEKDSVLIGKAAYHIWNSSGSQSVPRIFSKIFFKVQREKFAKFEAALSQHGILLSIGEMRVYVRKAQPLSLLALCQKTVQQNSCVLSMVPPNLSSSAKDVITPSVWWTR